MTGVKKAAFLLTATLLFVTIVAGRNPRDLRPGAVLARGQASGTRVVFVPAGGNLAAALEGVRAGDVVELEAGATDDGGFVLPAFDGDRPATLRTRGTLPDRRIGPQDLPRLATLRSTMGGVSPLTVPDGAHHWKIDGIAVTQTGGNVYGLLRLGSANGHASASMVPHHIEIDRLYAYVGDAVAERRGIQVNASDVVIRRSTVAGIKEAGADSQAIAGWDTPGRITIDDCDLEGAGENVMIGGADPSLANVIPTDITITNNDIRKPLAWRGQRWSVKNLLELKFARNVVIRNNRFDGNWPASQSGYSILFTPRNQNGRCKWCNVEDVLFERNVLRHAASGINILGSDDEAKPDQKPSTPAARITVRNNLLLIDGKTYQGDGRCYMVLAAPAQVTIDHNTCIADGTVLFVEAGGRGKATGFVFTNNVQLHNSYGIIGTGTASGSPTLAAFFDNPLVRNNVFGGGAGVPYPVSNQTVSTTMFLEQFANAAGGDYRVKAGSIWKGAGTDGKDLGADVGGPLR
jgi:hypothetical protein